jgi:regulator of sirC expression with transglutaminase-like and TPR domain
MDRDQPIWEQFVELVQSPDDQIDLAAAALLIAATEYPQLDVSDQLRVLDSLSAGASKRFSEEREPLYCLNTLSEYLFDEIGFRGNPEEYYDPRNSFLNEVLSRRLGIPITLSLVFIEVGKRLGIPFLGVGMPGHFLVRHRDDEGLFIDPFHRGVLLSEEECAERMREVTQANIAWDSRLLAPLSNREYVARMLRNLKGIYWQNRDSRRALAMIDRLVALYPESGRERRDRGLVHFQLGQHRQALGDLEFYLDSAPPNSDAEDVQRLVGRLKELLGS